MVKSPKTNKFWVLFSILLCRVGFWDFDSHSLSSSSFHIGISSSSNRAQRFGLSNYFSSEREREREIWAKKNENRKNGSETWGSEGSSRGDGSLPVSIHSGPASVLALDGRPGLCFRLSILPFLQL